MKNLLVAAILFLPLLSRAEEKSPVDQCLSVWKKAPFAKGAEPDEVVRPAVKVLGIGKQDYEDAPTEKPRLVLIKPNVNVLGNMKFHLMNPNGWYCFKSSVSVLGKVQIEADCRAHIAAASDGGANVLGADESDNGVTVLGTVRIKRHNCPPN